MPLPASFLLNPRITGRLIFALAFLLYVNTIPGTWAIDDGLVIHNNRSVQAGIAGWPAIFSSDFLGSNKDSALQTVAGGRYRPLTPAFFALCAELFARPARDGAGRIMHNDHGDRLHDLGAETAFPHILHLINALAYALLCWLLYNVLLALFRDRPHGPQIALLAAVLFAVHPLHTEAVANVKGLDEILSLLLALLSLKLFLSSGENRLKLVGGAVALVLAMLAKEIALGFVLIIPLTILCFHRADRGALSRAAVLAGLSLAVYLALRVAALGSLTGTGADNTNMMNNPFLVVAGGQTYAPLVPGSDVRVLQHPTTQSIRPMDPAYRYGTIAYTWLRYIGLFLLPAQLTYDYYPAGITPRPISDPLALFSVLLHVGMLVWAAAKLRKRTIPAYGVLFYLLTFLPVSNLLFPIGTNMAERFLFTPSLGLCIAAAVALITLARRIPDSVALAAAGLLLVLLGCRTLIRNLDWRDNFTLIRHDLGISSGSAKIRSDWGEVVLNRVAGERRAARTQGRQTRPAEEAAQAELLRSTLPLYKEALDVFPMYGLVWFNLARTHHRLGETGSLTPNERLTHLLTAVAAYNVTDTYKPRAYLAEVDTMKSLCHAALGKLYGEQFGMTAEALQHLHFARSINARNAYALFLLGTAHDIDGHPDSAYFYTRASYAIDSTDRDVMENLAHISQKLAASGLLAPDVLSESKALLGKVQKINAQVPDDAPEKAALIRHTTLLQQTNDSLQKQLIRPEPGR